MLYAQLEVWNNDYSELHVLQACVIDGCTG